MSAHETQHDGETLSLYEGPEAGIILDEELRVRALRPILRMLEMS